MAEPLTSHGTERRCPKNLFENCMMHQRTTAPRWFAIISTVNLHYPQLPCILIVNLDFEFCTGFNTRTFKSSRHTNHGRFVQVSLGFYIFPIFLTDINDAKCEQKQSFVVVFFIFIYTGLMFPSIIKSIDHRIF